ncbi:MAG: hypothetical protein AB1546_11165 [bacterium]
MDNKSIRTFLLLTFFILGMVSVFLQTILIREMLAVTYGNELIIGIILGAWLFWIFAGAQLAVPVSSNTRIIKPLFFFCILLLTTLSPLQIYLIRNIRLILHTPAGEYIPLIPTLLFCAAVIMPPCFIIGFTFPLGSTLFRRQNTSAAIDISRLYILESAGFLTGGMIFTFLLVTRFHSFAILGFAFMLTAVICYFVLMPRKLTSSLIYIILVLLFSAFCLFPFLNRLNNKTTESRWKSINPYLRLAKSVDSKYENITLAIGEDQYSVYDNGQYNFSFPDPYSTSLLANFLMSEHPEPKNILVIGSGNIDIACQMLPSPVNKIDYLLLDPKLLNTIRPFIPDSTDACLNDKRLNLIFTDGRSFVHNSTEKYDLVYVETRNPSTAAMNRFFTTEFFTAVKKVLHRRGTFAIGIAASENLLFGAAGNPTASLYHSIKQVFPNIIAIPGETNYYFASASTDIVTDNTETLAARFNRRNIHSPYFHPAMFQSLIQPYRIPQLLDSLQQKKNIRINTDTNPVTYFYNLLLWLSTLEAGGEQPVRATRFLMLTNRCGAGIITALLLSMAALFTLLLTVHRRSEIRRRKACALLSILLCGFTAMSLEMILILGYQNLFGVLYEKIAVITGTFMAGIAAGGAGANHCLRRRHPAAASAIGVHISFAAVSSLMIFWTSLLGSGSITSAPLSTQAAFLSIVLVCGALTGWIFPAACALFGGDAASTGKTAGWIDSLDHLGAALGAALCGSILIPVLGISAIGTFLAAANAAAALLWLLHLGIKKS